MKKVSEEKNECKNNNSNNISPSCILFHFISLFFSLRCFYRLHLYICTIEHSTIQINVLQTVSVSHMIYVVYFLATELFNFYILCSFSSLPEFKNDLLIFISIVRIRFIEWTIFLVVAIIHLQD